MSHLTKNLPVYQPNGIPAYAWVKIPNLPLTGDVVTINGDAYTFGTDFVGLSAAQALRSLMEAVNADQNAANEISPANTNFFRKYYAEMRGQYVVLFATVPGTGGNAFTLTTSNANRLAISGATFSGGTTQSATAGALTAAATLALTAGTTSQVVFAANPARQFLLIQNLSGEVMSVNFGAAAVLVGTAGGSIQLAASGAPGSILRFDGPFVPTGSVNINGTTTGDKFTAFQA